ncbi:MAG: NAD(P)-dependent oxidoreductase [Pseudomonadota bacterium]
MPTIVLAEPMHAVATEKLKQQPDTTVVQLPAGASDADIAAAIRDADAVAVRIANLPRAAINDAPRLRVVAKHGVGTDNIDVAACTERGIPVTVTADANKTSVVEHTLMFMLALAKKLVPLDRAVRAGDFHIRARPEGFGTDLGGQTALVIGVGRIGTALVPVLRAFGMKVIACDPALTETQAAELGCERVEAFAPHLARADFVTVHVPLSAETRGLIGAEELAAMKPTAYLINNARGGIVDEAALLEALDSGRIAGAGTDVFDGEPPAPDHPFFSSDRILLAPHGGGNTTQCLERMAAATANNIIAVLTPEVAGAIDPRCVVNGQVLSGKNSVTRT